MNKSVSEAVTVLVPNLKINTHLFPKRCRLKENVSLLIRPAIPTIHQAIRCDEGLKLLHRRNHRLKERSVLKLFEENMEMFLHLNQQKSVYSKHFSRAATMRKKRSSSVNSKADQFMKDFSNSLLMYRHNRGRNKLEKCESFAKNVRKYREEMNFRERENKSDLNKYKSTADDH